MDDTPFNRLTLAVATTPTRRTLTQVLARLSLAGGFGSLLGLAAAEAKKKPKPKNKNKQKHCPSGTKKCDGDCITQTHCCGGCASCPGLRCCDGRCANCCSGDDCASGVCVHGVCLAIVENDCPPSLAGLSREKGGVVCVYTNTTRPCDDDDDCPFGSTCMSGSVMSGSVCSTPCPPPE